jgi:hypothetical protein
VFLYETRKVNRRSQAQRVPRLLESPGQRDTGLDIAARSCREEGDPHRDSRLAVPPRLPSAKAGLDNGTGLVFGLTVFGFKMGFNASNYIRLYYQHQWQL